MVANDTLIETPFNDNHETSVSSAIEFTLNQMIDDDCDVLSFTESFENKNDVLMELELSASDLGAEIEHFLSDKADDFEDFVFGLDPLLDEKTSYTDDELLVEQVSEHFLGQVSSSVANGPQNKRLSISACAPARSKKKASRPRSSKRSDSFDDVMTKLDASMRRTAQTRTILLSSKSLPGFRKSLSLSQHGMEMVRNEIFNAKVNAHGKTSIPSVTKAGRRRSIKRRLSSMVMKRRLSQMNNEWTTKTSNFNLQGVSAGISSAVPLSSQMRMNIVRPYTLNTGSSSIGNFLRRTKKW